MAPHKQQKEYVAALDIGSNSFHLIIAQVHRDGSFTVLNREKAVLRLGSIHPDGFTYIKPEDIAHAVRLIKHALRVADLYHTGIRIVSTSAVRESVNRDEFITAVRTETGCEIEVIDGKTEAGLIYQGIIHGVPAKHEKILAFDIGGGSTEFILGENGKPNFLTSVPLGAVRLSRMFFPDFIVREGAVELCKKHIVAILDDVKKHTDASDFHLVIGSAGTVKSCMQVAEANAFMPKREGMFRKLSPAAMQSVLQLLLASPTPEQRNAIPGLESKRADIAPVGALILSSIFQHLGIQEVIYSDFALREGVILDTISKLKKHES